MRLHVKEGREKEKKKKKKQSERIEGDSSWTWTQSQSGNAEQGSQRPLGDPPGRKKREVRREGGSTDKHKVVQHTLTQGGYEQQKEEKRERDLHLSSE